MMKKLFFIFAFFALIVACTDNESEGELSPNQHPKEPSISLDATTANFSSNGGNNTITFTSSEAWTAQAINSRADEWCSVNPTSGNAGSPVETMVIWEISLFSVSPTARLLML